jgi:hypothetical protein
MTIDTSRHDRTRLLGDRATHPIERILTRLGALLHPWRFSGALRRRAYPGTPGYAHSGAFNCRIQVK